MTQGDTLAVLGSYTDGGGDGLWTFRVDGTTLTPRDGAEEVNPSFLDVHPSEPVVVAVTEHDDGTTVSYRVDSRTGDIDRLNGTGTGDDGPCHVAIGPRGKYAVVSHYTGGSVALLAIDSNGEIHGPLDLHRHSGAGPRRDRQSAPHPHSSWFVTESVVYVPDLGADKLVVYELDRTEGCLRPVPDATVECRPGSGPRHLAVHPEHAIGYLVNELDATLSILDLDIPRRPTLIETQATLPDTTDASGTIAADVQVHPSGDYVFVSNRGHDSIATFECRGSPSQVTRTAVTKTDGQHPRNVAVHPNGDRLFVCHTHSDDVVAIEFDAETGELEPVASRTETGAPACLRFL